MSSSKISLSITRNVKPLPTQDDSDESDCEFDNMLFVDESKKITFDSTWKLWLHSHDNHDWSISSYSSICDIHNVYDMWSCLNVLKVLDCVNYQFFIMKNNILPMWESPENEKGAAIVIKTLYSDSHFWDIWELLVIKTLIGSVIKLDNNIVNGVSLNMKNDYATLKIWINTTLSFNHAIMCDEIFKYVANPKFISYTYNRTGSNDTYVRQKDSQSSFAYKKNRDNNQRSNSTKYNSGLFKKY